MKINWLNLITWLLLLMISIVSIAILIRFLDFGPWFSFIDIFDFKKGDKK